MKTISKNKQGKNSFILTVVIGLLAIGFAVIALLGIVQENMPGWTYIFIIPSIILFVIEIKISAGIAIGVDMNSREELISQKLIKSNFPGYSFLMKTSEEFTRGNYYLAAGDKGIIVVLLGTTNKIVKVFNYENIKSFSMVAKGRTSTFIIELNNGKKYKLFKSENKKLLYKLKSFTNFVATLNSHIRIEGFN